MRHLYTTANEHEVIRCVFCNLSWGEVENDAEDCPDTSDRLDAICASMYEETHAYSGIARWDDCSAGVQEEYRSMLRAGLKTLMEGKP